MENSCCRAVLIYSKLSKIHLAIPMKMVKIIMQRFQINFNQIHLIVYNTSTLPAAHEDWPPPPESVPAAFPALSALGEQYALLFKTLPLCSRTGNGPCEDLTGAAKMRNLDPNHPFSHFWGRNGHVNIQPTSS